MELAFYGASLIAILSTLGVVTGTNPMHALLYLIVSLLAVSMVFFTLGADFAGIMQVIVYAGAIMVLFVFVVMMLNLSTAQTQERQLLQPATWVGPVLLSLGLLIVLYAAVQGVPGVMEGKLISAKAVGIALYGPYVLAVELASMLLLAGLVAAYHLGREDRRGELISLRKEEDDV